MSEGHGPSASNPHARARSIAGRRMSTRAPALLGAEVAVVPRVGIDGRHPDARTRHSGRAQGVVGETDRLHHLVLRDVRDDVLEGDVAGDPGRHQLVEHVHFGVVAGEAQVSGDVAVLVFGIEAREVHRCLVERAEQDAVGRSRAGEVDRRVEGAKARAASRLGHLGEADFVRGDGVGGQERDAGSFPPFAKLVRADLPQGEAGSRLPLAELEHMTVPDDEHGCRGHCLPVGQQAGDELRADARRVPGNDRDAGEGGRHGPFPPLARGIAELERGRGAVRTGLDRPGRTTPRRLSTPDNVLNGIIFSRRSIETERVPATAPMDRAKSYTMRRRKRTATGGGLQSEDRTRQTATGSMCRWGIAPGAPAWRTRWSKARSGGHAGGAGRLCIAGRGARVDFSPLLTRHRERRMAHGARRAAIGAGLAGEEPGLEPGEQLKEKGKE